MSFSSKRSAWRTAFSTRLSPKCRVLRLITFAAGADEGAGNHRRRRDGRRSEEHASELQSLMRISYAVFCLKKKYPNYIPKTHYFVMTTLLTNTYTTTLT